MDDAGKKMKTILPIHQHREAQQRSHFEEYPLGFINNKNRSVRKKLSTTRESFTLPELSVRSTITAALRKREKSGREKERERQRETSRAEGGSS